jgi:nanoRNase/pAp phosphatase (c-di-AMP/oligoRNAs hydrolase)
MTAFVESCAKTVTGSAAAVMRQSRGRPKAPRLLRLLADKKHILITTHEHPDPDATASCLALQALLRHSLHGADVQVALKGRVGGGLNEIFAKLIDLDALAWDESTLGDYDAILLLDTQPTFANSPLPAGITPFAVIDHHRGRGRRPACAFCDIRADVGSTGAIIFSYYMELERPIDADLGATLLFAIESDLAGAAGQPGELDNVALSSLTLIADTRKLYKMRYIDLPQSVYVAYAKGLSNATYYDFAIMTHLEEIDSPEKPATVADFLLRFDQVQFALVTAVYNNSLVMSLRTSSSRMTAAKLVRRLVRNIGDGGGHRTKAGGGIPLANGTPTEIERLRSILRRRYLRALGIKMSRGQRLVPMG